eukprot:SAG31_NODE_10341_length_1152_cov_2.511871_2_plen_102_part_00
MPELIISILNLIWIISIAGDRACARVPDQVSGIGTSKIPYGLVIAHNYRAAAGIRIAASAICYLYWSIARCIARAAARGARVVSIGPVLWRARWTLSTLLT